jgi:hypothetical protein
VEAASDYANIYSGRLLLLEIAGPTSCRATEMDKFGGACTLLRIKMKIDNEQH